MRGSNEEHCGTKDSTANRRFRFPDRIVQRMGKCNLLTTTPTPQICSFDGCCPKRYRLNLEHIRAESETRAPSESYAYIRDKPSISADNPPPLHSYHYLAQTKNDDSNPRHWYLCRDRQAMVTPTLLSIAQRPCRAEQARRRHLDQREPQLLPRR